MKSRRAVEDIVGGQQVVTDVVQALVGILIRDVVASQGTLLGLVRQEEELVAGADTDFLPDCITVLEPKKLRGLVGRHVWRELRDLIALRLECVSLKSLEVDVWLR